MNIKVITPPITEPVSLSDIKLYLRIDHVDEDALLNSLIKSAREQAENRTNRALATQTFELVVDKIEKNPMTIPLPPLQSVDSITYKYEGTEYTLDTSQYSYDVDLEPSKLTFETIPSFNVMKIKFTAGYDTTNIPESIKQAIKLFVSHGYENRTITTDKSVNKVPFAFDALLASQRVYT
jgi:uncharacterized phiE125 gp8 family phage protein